MPEDLVARRTRVLGPRIARVPARKLVDLLVDHLDTFSKVRALVH